MKRPIRRILGGLVIFAAGLLLVGWLTAVFFRVRWNLWDAVTDRHVLLAMAIYLVIAVLFNLIRWVAGRDD